MNNKWYTSLIVLLVGMLIAPTVLFARTEAPDPPVSGGKSAEKQEDSYIYGQWNVWVSQETLNSRAAHQLTGSLNNEAIESEHSLDFNEVGNGGSSEANGLTFTSGTLATSTGLSQQGIVDSARRYLDSPVDTSLPQDVQDVINAAKQAASSKTGGLTDAEILEYFDDAFRKAVTNDLTSTADNPAAVRNLLNRYQGFIFEQKVFTEQQALGNTGFKLADVFNQPGYDGINDDVKRIYQIKTNGKFATSQTYVRDVFNSLNKEVDTYIELTGREYKGFVILDADTYDELMANQKMVDFLDNEGLLNRIQRSTHSKDFIRNFLKNHGGTLTRYIDELPEGTKGLGSIGTKSGFLKNMWGNFTKYGKSSLGGFFTFAGKMGGAVLGAAGTYFGAIETYTEFTTMMEAFGSGNVGEGITALIASLGAGIGTVGSVIGTVAAIGAMIFGTAAMAAVAQVAVVLGLVSLAVYGVVLVVRHWDEIVDFMDEHWKKVWIISPVIAGGFGAYFMARDNWDVIVPVLQSAQDWWGAQSTLEKTLYIGAPALGLAATIGKSAWNGVKNFFNNTSESGQTDIDVQRGVVTDEYVVASANPLLDAAQNFGGALSSAYNTVSGAVETSADMVGDQLSEAVDAVNPFTINEAHAAEPTIADLGPIEAFGTATVVGGTRNAVVGEDLTWLEKVADGADWLDKNFTRPVGDFLTFGQFSKAFDNVGEAGQRLGHEGVSLSTVGGAIWEVGKGTVGVGGTAFITGLTSGIGIEGKITWQGGKATLSQLSKAKARKTAWGNGLITSKIFGNAQSTGTLGHSAISKLHAFKEALKPSTLKVTLDHGYKSLFHGTKFAQKAKKFTKYGPRPDTAVLFNNGKVRVVEVMSKTDKISILRNRNIKYLKRNSIQVIARPVVDKSATTIQRIFGK